MELSTTLSKTFRQIESDRGTSTLAALTLEGVLETLHAFKAISVEDYYTQFTELLLLCKRTHPRIGMIIYQMSQVWDELQRHKASMQSLEDVRTLVTKRVYALQEQANNERAQLLANGLTCIEDNDSILIHSHSGTVLELIEVAYQQRSGIRVVLAEQEEEKTEDMIRFLTVRQIPFVVVPEYMLSHIETEVNKVFLGGTTFNNQYTFITDAGTTSVVSEFHHAHVPIYMFMNEKKFSLWDTQDHQQTYKKAQQRSHFHPECAVTYERIKFTHDRVASSLITHVVTEGGVFTPEQLHARFDEIYQENNAWREKHFG